jgi:hypothetical protein
MLCRVAIVGTDVSEELSASFIRGAKFLRNVGSYNSHSHRRENLKSYTLSLYSLT